MGTIAAMAGHVVGAIYVIEGGHSGRWETGIRIERHDAGIFRC